MSRTWTSSLIPCLIVYLLWIPNEDDDVVGLLIGKGFRLKEVMADRLASRCSFPNHLHPRRWHTRRPTHAVFPVGDVTVYSFARPQRKVARSDAPTILHLYVHPSGLVFPVPHPAAPLVRHRVRIHLRMTADTDPPRTQRAIQRVGVTTGRLSAKQMARMDPG